ncbi:NB-ARC domain disease resistance protein, putative [Medicago truncatula]|uniref:NB-ARC domain disease resistance protein, putative n=1 Tax=Medicago truncatula TaxID=3880 RepID=G7IZ62_MEDTR|nr:NB-ARC domain disease resistance protein, putative [Medicago truncatula]
MEENWMSCEALQSNSNLKKLNIKRYKGNRFPSWLSWLKGCGLCSRLPRLWQLPSL